MAVPRGTAPFDKITINLNSCRHNIIAFNSKHKHLIAQKNYYNLFEIKHYIIGYYYLFKILIQYNFNLAS